MTRLSGPSGDDVPRGTSHDGTCAYCLGHGRLFSTGRRFICGLCWMDTFKEVPDPDAFTFQPHA